MRRRAKMELKKILLTDAYEQYKTEHKSRGTSDSTMATYNLHINSFLNYCECDKFDIYTAMMDKDFWIYYIQDLQEDEKKKDVTISSYCRSVRAFLYWCMDADYMEEELLKIPKFEKTIKPTYTQEEITRLLEKPEKNCSEVTYQTWVFVNLIMATALRLSSALNIKLTDYVPKERLLYIQKTKKKKAFQLYLNQDVCNIINKYIKVFDLNDEDYLFCTANRTRMAKRTMQGNIKTFNESRGVNKTSCHLMRHTFSKNYYNETKDIYSLQQILSHSTITTTEQYLGDLGLTEVNSTAYNPQQKFAMKEKENKRRSKRMQ